MKVKFYTVLISAFLFAFAPALSQYSDDDYYYDGNTRIVVNNYYSDYDYYWSSRINRFHRMYTTFDYYSPVFTDLYWYDYRPFTWGISIYGGVPGFSMIYDIYYPVYYPVNYYYYGWYNLYDPYYYTSWYWGYRPWYTSYWYSPFAFNIYIGHSWHNHYRVWNRYDFWHNNYRWNNYYSYSHGRRSGNYYSDYGSTRYSTRNSSSVYSSRRSDDGLYANRDYSRRGSSGSIPVNSARTQSVQRRYSETGAGDARRTHAVTAERRQVSERGAAQSSAGGRRVMEAQANYERRSSSQVINSNSAVRRSPDLPHQSTRSSHQANISQRRPSPSAGNYSALGSHSTAFRSSSMNRNPMVRQSSPSQSRSPVASSSRQQQSFSHRSSSAPQMRSSSGTAGSRSGSAGSSRSGRR